MPEFVIHYERCIRPQDTVEQYVAICELALVVGNYQQKKDFKRLNYSQFIKHYAKYPDQLEGLFQILEQLPEPNKC